MKTTIISLFGGPGSGKSINASRIYAYLKEHGKCAELVTEYVKQWAWEDRTITDLDQIYFFAKQSRSEYTLFNKVEYIVTDSPVALASYYGSQNGELKTCFKEMLKAYYGVCKNSDINHINIFLNRNKHFDDRGRFHNLEQSIQIDKELRIFLEDNDVKFMEIDSKENVINDLVKEIMKF